MMLTSCCAQSEGNDSDASSFAADNCVGGEDTESSSDDERHAQYDEDESDFLLSGYGCSR